MKVLITGAQGQLGFSLIQAFDKPSYTIYPFSKKDLDITDFSKSQSITKHYVGSELMYQSVLPTKLTELGMADSSYFQTHKALRMLSKSIGKTVCVLTSHRLEIVKVVFGDSMKEANSKLVSKMNDLDNF